MNEFLEQFLIESREHVEQATADLLALEEAPDDRERLDSVFRAFHTLKGGAGIVDFFPMAHAMHACEDELSGVRSGAMKVSAAMISDSLECLDQVTRWLDTLEATGELPRDAVADADRIVARFVRPAGGAVAPAPASESADWLDALLVRKASLRPQARTAIRYAPDRKCFHAGEDPVARVAALPGLLGLDIEPVTPWPALDALDPFVCNVVITALTGCSPTEAATALADVIDDCEVLAVASAGPGSEDASLPTIARDVLAAQRALLEEVGGGRVAGRLASAGLVSANVLRHVGRAADAERIAQATATRVAANDPHPLRSALDAVLAARTEAADAPAVAVDPDVAPRTLRIDAARIDALVNLTGELIVAKNSIGHAAVLAQEGDQALAAVLRQRHALLENLVGELQRSVLAMRVLPLRHVFQRLPRLVREISQDLGKPVELKIDGGDTEADKTIVEMLFEPLQHVLRNAIDHGVEDAATRLVQGKPATATIRLRASRQGDHVLVEVADDGRGIDFARIREVASERKLVADDVLATMSDAELTELIFEPGFSTAGTVTGLSGRGVGMDAVRHAVARVAGSVGVESRPGQGTTARFTLPFSVMMSRIVLVGAGDRVFGIPLDVVVETLRIDAAAIVPIGAAQAFVLRNQTIPLVNLADAVGLARNERMDPEATIVVVRLEGQIGALRVDWIGERMEVMLKPLDGLLAGMRGLAGSTLLGDGSVLLVLDLGELF